MYTKIEDKEEWATVEFNDKGEAMVRSSKVDLIDFFRPARFEAIDIVEIRVTETIVRLMRSPSTVAQWKTILGSMRFVER